MSTPSLLVRRPVSVCLSCRRQLLRGLRQRQFSTTPLAAYQAYTLPSHPPVSPRNANVPDTSIAHPVPSPPLPRIHETRPPQQPDAPLLLDTSTTTADQAAAPVSLPEREAQQSKPEFVATAAAAAAAAPPSSSSSSSPAQPAPTTTTTTTSSSPTAPSPSSSTAQQAPPTAAGTRPRSRLLRTPRKAALRLTPAAVAHLRELLDQPGEEGGPAKLVKVGVRNRGCSGLAYHLQLVDGAGALDETVEQDGVRVVIDSKALFSVIGSEMDWVEDKLSQRFVFRNPNIKEECGCGESFMV